MALSDTTNRQGYTCNGATTAFAFSHPFHAQADLVVLKVLISTGAETVLPAKTLSDIPVVKAFVVRYPSASAQNIQDFYDGYYEKRKVYDTIMAKAKEGDLEAVEKTMRFDPSATIQLSAIREALTQQSMLIRNVWKDPAMSPSDKRQLIDTLYFRMMELAEAGNRGLRDAEKLMDKP